MRKTLLPLLGLAMAALLPAPASAAPGLELGVQDDSVLLHRSYSDSALALDRAKEMGADRIRVNLAWWQAMPVEQARTKSRPQTVDWNFSALERLYADATARGLKLQVTLTGMAPAWASGNRKVSYTRPDARRFAEFASAAATAFAGRIDRWSIWNEPNWHRLLQPTKRAPALYRALYRSGYAAIKAADPGAAVLIGEMMPGANRTKSTPVLKFLRRVTCSRSDYRAARRCSGLRADGFALHPYNFARRPGQAVNANRDIVEMGSLSRLTRALDKLRRRGALRTPGNGRMPLYLTEFGYFTKGPVARSASTHARWMTEAWKIARRNPRVRQLLQYLLIDPWPKDVSWRTAVMTRDATRRPVFHALKRLAN